MILWRVSPYTALTGEGGLHSDGRWHRVGRRIIYTAETPALALLEALVQFRPSGTLPRRYQLLQLRVTADANPAQFGGDLPPEDVSQNWGDAWLADGRTVLARVPAAVAPYSWNWLVNPAVDGASTLELVSAEHFSWDERLSR